MSELTFITGGARSGKSALAVQIALESDGKVAFIATASAGDEEMERRILMHKKSRPEKWTTIEEPRDIASAITSAHGYDIVIIDCLTLLLSNLICECSDLDETDWILEEVKKIAESARDFEGKVIVISNEVGMGIVPENRLAREFRDLAGKANQIMAKSADRIYVCFSGITIQIKG